MLQHVNTVLVGSGLLTAAATSTADKGKYAFFNENGVVVTSSTSDEAEKLAIGVCTGGDTVGGVFVPSYKLTPYLQKKAITSVTSDKFVGATQQIATISMDGLSTTAGLRYVLRIVYKDIYEAPGQFTHTYEVIATGTSAMNLLNSFATKINNHRNRRVNASVAVAQKATKTIGGITFEAVTAGEAGNDITVQFISAGTAAVSVTGNAVVITPASGALTLAAIQAQIAGSTAAAALIAATAGTASGSAVAATNLADGTNDSNELVLTAIEKDDNDGIDSINEYSTVNMDVTLYSTNPSEPFLSNVPAQVGTISVTAGNPGVGYWKQVRDMERRALGYAGQVMTGAYPVVSGKMYTTEDYEYDVVTIQAENLYNSNDNQYIKNTPITADLFIKKTDTNGAAAGTLTAVITAFQG